MMTDPFFALAITAMIALFFIGAGAMRPRRRVPVRHRAESFRGR